MLRRAFVLLLAAAGLASGLAACGSSDSGPPAVSIQPRAQNPRVAPNSFDPGKVAILLPLSGKLAEIGTPMLRAAQLALDFPGAPALDIKDTRGTAEGASQAANEAIEAGARLLLGPLTSQETAYVGPIARSARVPVLAFTNDAAQSLPGVWPLGITPGQQVQRLVDAVREAEKGPIAALLPDDDFGRSMGDALTRIIAANDQRPPFVRMYQPGRDNIVSAVNELAGQAEIGQPPPYGAILLAATGNDLKLFAKAFADAKIDRAKVQILGPGLWGDPASGSAVMTGAWFAMPDPDARQTLVADYTAKYREAPPPRADIASDAASIARALAARGQMTMGGLTQSFGFTGVDGWFVLLPDGQVRRSLAVFRVGHGARPERIGKAPEPPGPVGSRTGG